MKKKTNGKVYNIILLSFLAIVFLVGFIASSREVMIVLFGQKTEGVVLDSTYYGGRNGKWVTKISYLDGDDNSYTYQTIGTMQPIHNNGDVITVYYNKNNPSQAVELSLFIVIGLLLSAIFLFFTVFAIIKFSKEK